MQEPMPKLRQASEALDLHWQRPPSPVDMACALTLLDALQDSLSARGIPWREVLRQARQSPLG
jgi:hypothetical protein